MTKRRLTATPTEIAKDIVEEFWRRDITMMGYGSMGYMPCTNKSMVKLIASRIKLYMYYEKGKNV